MKYTGQVFRLALKNTKQQNTGRRTTVKKLLILFLAVIMIFSLAACGGNNDDSGDENNGESAPPQINFDSIMAGNGSTSTIWGLQDDEIKQQIIADGETEGLEVSFGTDGSMTVYDPKLDETVKQNPDGTWTVISGEGSEGELDEDWPDNEYTKLLPAPEFKLSDTSVNEDYFAINFNETTVESIRSYVEKLKSNGFTHSVNVTDRLVYGIPVYFFQAQNEDGYTVTVNYSSNGTTGLTLAKPQ